MPDTISTEPPRERLRAAIKRRRERQRQLALADAALKRGEECVAAAEAKLKVYSGVDRMAADWRASKLRSAVDAGSDAGVLDLPRDIAVFEELRDKAKAEIEAAGMVRGQLAAERAEAQRLDDQALFEVLELAQAVLFAETNHLAAALRAARCAFVAAYHQLQALSRVYARIPGGVGPIAVGLDAVKELQIAAPFCEEAYTRLGTTQKVPTTEAYRAALDALAENADAKLPAIEGSN